MSQDEFQAIVDARAIAIIGASSNPESLSGRPLDYLRQHGYDGRVYPVNPAREEVQGLKAYPSLGDVPEQVDLAMVAVRAELVPAALRDCVEAGVRVAVIVSSGFGEGGSVEGGGQGAGLRDEVLQVLAGTNLRVIGPNCEGVLSMPNRMPFTFSPVADTEKTGRSLVAGDVAVVSQSGGLAFAVAQWGSESGLGVSYV
ncbi:MAG: CoA-binding protein, partial [Acidimicrobiaceae bacterium]|nr:CoA-binding protein [Acidimicrobiaceae bacterium]